MNPREVDHPFEIQIYFSKYFSDTNFLLSPFFFCQGCWERWISQLTMSWLPSIKKVALQLFQWEVLLWKSSRHDGLTLQSFSEWEKSKKRWLLRVLKELDIQVLINLLLLLLNLSVSFSKLITFSLECAERRHRRQKRTNQMEWVNCYKGGLNLNQEYKYLIRTSKHLKRGLKNLSHLLVWGKCIYPKTRVIRVICFWIFRKTALHFGEVIEISINLLRFFYDFVMNFIKFLVMIYALFPPILLRLKKQDP